MSAGTSIYLSQVFFCHWLFLHILKTDLSACLIIFTFICHLQAALYLFVSSILTWMSFTWSKSRSQPTLRPPEPCNQYCHCDTWWWRHWWYLISLVTLDDDDHQQEEEGQHDWWKGASWRWIIVWWAPEGSRGLYRAELWCFNAVARMPHIGRIVFNMVFPLLLLLWKLWKTVESW